MNKELTVGYILKSSWIAVKANIWILSGLFFVYMVLSQVIQLFAGSNYASLRFIFFNIAVYVVTLLFYGGYIKNIMQAFNGDEPQFKAFGEMSGRILNLFISSILFIIAAVIGLALFIIPGIYIMLRLQFYIIAIVDKNMNPIEALQYSWKISRGHVWKLFLIYLTQLGLSILGILLLFIGIIFTTPIAISMQVKTYKILTKEETEEEAWLSL
ncbi:MAG TPA: hypothetical protein DCF91_02610 [Porphyromonadaceae bacterium]|nr:hypothetical protein [Porphyromonadaceae bacterium]